MVMQICLNKPSWKRSLAWMIAEIDFGLQFRRAWQTGVAKGVALIVASAAVAVEIVDVVTVDVVAAGGADAVTKMRRNGFL